MTSSTRSVSAPPAILTIDIGRLSTAIVENDPAIKTQFGGETALSAVPYVRHTCFISSVLGLSGWSADDINIAFQLMYIISNRRVLISSLMSIKV
jgi:hypothetical protein